MKRISALAIAVAGLFATSAAPCPATTMSLSAAEPSTTVRAALPMSAMSRSRATRSSMSDRTPLDARRASIDASGQGRLARLHQHAELGRREPDRGRPRHERHPPGRHARGLRRRRFDGTAEPRDEATGGEAAGRHQISDHAGRRSANISNISQNKGVTPNVASFVGATTVRVHELGEKDIDPTPAQLERMRALVRAGDEGRRARRRLGADLCACHLRRDARADRARHRSRQMRRHVHQPHALRGEQAARSDR